MLVLARKVNESLMIGDEIEVKLLSIDGDTVRLGIGTQGRVDPPQGALLSSSGSQQVGCRSFE